MNGINDLSLIEKLKILKTISLGCSSEEEFKKYIIEYSSDLDPQEVRRRINGLLLEDEFLLLCKIMKSCHLINGLEQGLVTSDNLKVPDYLAVFNLKNCMYDCERKLDSLPTLIEVKTTDNLEIKNLSSGFFEKYVNYARHLGLHFLIASRLKLNEKQQYWIIQTKRQYRENGRKASINQLCDSVNHILLNDYFITATKDIFIELTMREKPGVSDIYSPGEGYLESIKIKTDISCKTLLREEFCFNIFLDCFAQHKVSTEKIGDELKVIRKIDLMQNQLLSNMLLRANFSTLDANGASYTNASRLLALSDSGKSTLIHRDYFESLLHYFNSDEILFMITKIGNAEENERLVNLLLEVNEEMKPANNRHHVND